MKIEQPSSEYGSVSTLAVVSLIVGAATGLVGVAFHACLEYANRLREQLVDWAGQGSVIGPATVIAVCAAAAAVAAWLVRRFSPHAAGSGIPHVEAVLDERLQPAPFRLIPVKFVGGVLAIGAGLALGREGPSVQIGASLAHLSGRIFRRNWHDCRVLMAAGAGAGLATAFNAPLAGAIFVLEELVRRFETRIAIAALGASATAMSVARLFLGETPEFQVPDLPYPNSQSLTLFFLLGAIAGVVGVAYNNTLLATMRVFSGAWLQRWPVELRAAAVGALVGLLAYFAPGVVGGGELLTQQTLEGAISLGLLPTVLAIRFGLGPISYAARTPGGLFAPMLVIGAQLGLLFGTGCQFAWPELNMPVQAFAVVGMAAFFTAVVRAPITGIALIAEMTGNFTLSLPMLGAGFMAILVPTLLGNSPIYEALRERDAPPK